MNALRNVGRLAVRSPNVRTQTTKIQTSEHLIEEIKNTDPAFIKFKHRQAFFQKEDGQPIFLKGGYGDKMLYYLTMTLCGIGTAGATVYLWQSASPAKND